MFSCVYQNNAATTPFSTSFHRGIWYFMLMLWVSHLEQCVQLCFLRKGWIQGRTSTWFVRISLHTRVKVTHGLGLGLSVINLILSVSLAQVGTSQAPAHRGGDSPGQSQLPACLVWLWGNLTMCLRVGPCQAHSPFQYRSLSSCTAFLPSNHLTQSTDPGQRHESWKERLPVLQIMLLLVPFLTCRIRLELPSASWQNFS